ncbi:MAG: hypothetical protein WD342_07295 [Verrucomicrobiales bacterium]
MNPKTLAYLSRSDLTESEETSLLRELSSAYHMDEASARSREVRNLVERVKSRIEEVTNTHVPSSEDPSPRDE